MSKLPFHTLAIAPSGFEGRLAQHQLLENSFTHPVSDFSGSHGAPHMCCVILGLYPGSRLPALLPRRSTLLMADRHGIFLKSDDPVIENERERIRACFLEEIKECNVLEIGRYSHELVSLIPDGTVELLYIQGDIDPSQIIDELRLWTPKLAPRATIMGDVYGIPGSSLASYVIASMLGIPDVLTFYGRWATSFKDNLRVGGASSAEDSNRTGVVLLGRNGDHGKLLITLYSARRYWHGPIEVWVETPNLTVQIACYKLQATYVDQRSFGSSYSTALEMLAANSPFDRSIVLQSGHLLLAAPALGGAPMDEIVSPTKPWLIETRSSGPHILGLDCHDASSFAEAGQVPVLDCSGEATTFSEAAWDKWCDAEIEATLYGRVQIKVAPDSTVVTVVNSETLGDFQRNWLTWDFGNTTTIIILVDLEKADFWLPAGKEVQVYHIQSVPDSSSRGICSILKTVCRTGRIVFLSPKASAYPSAELWARLNENVRAFCIPEHVIEEYNLSGNLFLPEAECALIQTGDIDQLGPWDVASQSGLAMALGSWAVQIRQKSHLVVLTDASEMGWSLSRRFLLANHNSDDRQQKVPALSPKEDGKYALAEDVVVISLPERIDRRSNLSAMMDRENIRFRFVPGVRVSRSEIVPSEIAEVQIEGYKCIAGIDAYYCGMVGCRQAHIRELQHALGAGLETLLIFEDDVRFIPGWQEILGPALDELPEGWMQLYLSAMELKPSIPISPHLRRITAAFQNTAVLYSRKGIIAALRCLHSSRKEIDVWLAEHLHPFGNSYLLNTQITYQNGGFSDIMGKDRGIIP